MPGPFHNRPFISLALVILLDSTALASSESSTAESDWRALIRNADLNLKAPGGPQKAVLIYQQAIDMISARKDLQEPCLDLYLNQADAYRRCDQVDKAEQILAKVKETALKTKLIDPLLKVRYLRRRAELYYSEGQCDKCADYRLAAVKTLRSLLPGCGNAELIETSFLIIVRGDIENSIKVLRGVNLGLQSSADREKTRAEAVGAYKEIRSRLDKIDEKCAVFNLLLPIASRFSISDPQVSKDILDYFKSRSDDTKLSSEDSKSMEVYLKQLRPQSLKEQCVKNYSIASALLDRAEAEQALKELELAQKLADELNEPDLKKLIGQRIIEAARHISRYKKDLPNKLLESARQSLGEHDYQRLYVKSSFVLATALTRRNEAASARKVLDSIPQIYEKDFPNFLIRKLIVELRIGLAYARTGNNQDALERYKYCSQKFNEIKSGLKGINPDILITYNKTEKELLRLLISNGVKVPPCN
ncbi:MAG: hypothetical protein K2X27_01855 [Candidatus Obscuribacterales bacterium]|nr:hypothetical protein [Candidatus Obscuribacterales bacterium]